MGLFSKQNSKKLRASGDVEGLIQLLAHEEAATRIAAAQALGELRDDRAIQPLVSVVLADPYTDKRYLLGDEQHWPVCAAAARALAAIGPHAVDPLMDAMKDANAQPKVF